MRQFVVQQQVDGQWNNVTPPLSRADAEAELKARENNGFPIRIQDVTEDD